MILKFMGITDLFIALIIILIPLEIVSWKIALIATLYLFFKAFTFKGDFASIIDGMSGIYIILAFTGISTILAPVFSIYLAQKSFFSFL